MKKFFLSILALALVIGAGAQSKTSKASSAAPKTSPEPKSSVAASRPSASSRFSPKAGDISLGLAIDPVAASAFSVQPGDGEFLGDYISSIASNPQQMFLISPSSALAVRMKYYLNNNTALKFTLGFSGSLSYYKEYVTDDLALSLDAKSKDLVTDVLKSKLNGASISVGFEKILGTGAFRFTYGASLGYAIGGGCLTMEYGNKYGVYNNFNPTIMPYCVAGSDKGVLNNITAADLVKMFAGSARPIQRYNMGACQSLGIMMDLGIEWFAFDRMSIGAQLSVLPACFYFQPETFGRYEGFSTDTGKVEAYDKLVSPGSTSLTYGLGNLGIKLSLNYYL